MILFRYDMVQQEFTKLETWRQAGNEIDRTPDILGLHVLNIKIIRVRGGMLEVITVMCLYLILVEA